MMMPITDTCYYLKHPHQEHVSDYHKAYDESKSMILLKMLRYMGNHQRTIDQNDPQQDDLVQLYLQRLNRIISICDHLNWMNADHWAEHIVFQLYSISYQHDQQTWNNLKRIAKLKKRSDEYEFDIGSILCDDAILDFLWNDIGARTIIMSWLDQYLLLERKFGVVSPAYKSYEAHILQRVLHLLRGFTSSGCMQLPSYHRIPKQKLSKQEWFDQMKSNKLTFQSFWE